MQRRHDNVRRLVLAKLQNDLRQVGLERFDARRFDGRIQLNLRRGHRLDLDDFAGLLLAKNVENNLRGPRLRRAAQCTTPPAAVQRSSNCVKVVFADSRARACACAEAAARSSCQSAFSATSLLRLPWITSVACATFLRNCVLRRMVKRRLRKGRRYSSDPELDGRSHAWLIRSLPWAWLGAGQDLRHVQRLHGLRIARCSAPPMCIRQLLSSAVQYSARGGEHVSQAWLESMADDTSAFLTENVPPNPQHRSRFASGTSSSPRTLASKPERPFAQVQSPQPMATGVIGDPVRKISAHILHAQLVDQELAQFVHARQQRRELLAQFFVPKFLKEPGVLVADHGDARRRGNHHRVRILVDAHETLGLRIGLGCGSRYWRASVRSRSAPAGTPPPRPAAPAA